MADGEGNSVVAYFTRGGAVTDFLLISGLLCNRVKGKWASLHQEELLHNWELAMACKPLDLEKVFGHRGHRVLREKIILLL